MIILVVASGDFHKLWDALLEKGQHLSYVGNGEQEGKHTHTQSLTKEKLKSTQVKSELLSVLVQR